MQHTFQTAVSFEASARAPVELSLEQLQHVAGGFGPNDSWGAAVSGPNDSWLTAPKGPNDNWL